MTKKKADPEPAPEIPAPEPIPEPAPERLACVNCGQTATHQTTNPGANVSHYCATCAGIVYPGEGLEEIRDQGRGHAELEAPAEGRAGDQGGPTV